MSNRYAVTVDVHKTYLVHVDAENEEEAWSLVDAMQTTEIAAQGSLKHISTEVTEVDADIH